MQVNIPVPWSIWDMENHTIYMVLYIPGGAITDFILVCNFSI